MTVAQCEIQCDAGELDSLNMAHLCYKERKQQL